jgi:topoisomerase-4 subunit B
VVVDEDHSIPEVLTFYMGKNTQERRTYIMENLVVDEEIL